MKLARLFRVARRGAEARFGRNGAARAARAHGPTALLWHGSRTSNVASILAQGLRVAPKEAPSTGFMFGKGIYFADMSSKSANYCVPSRDNKRGFLLLCEVATGKPHDVTRADYLEPPLPGGAHSTRGLGGFGPGGGAAGGPARLAAAAAGSKKAAAAAAKGKKKRAGAEGRSATGAVVPLQRPRPTGVKGSSLLYNEHVSPLLALA